MARYEGKQSEIIKMLRVQPREDKEAWTRRTRCKECWIGQGSVRMWGQLVGHLLSS